MSRILLSLLICTLSIPAGAAWRLQGGRIIGLGDSNGIIDLPAQYVRFESTKDRPGMWIYFERGFWTVDNWKKRAEKLAWFANAPAAGRYRVIVEMSCPGGHAGAGIRIKTGNSTCTFRVPGTRHWNDFIALTVSGSLSLKRGVNRIEFSLRSDRRVRALLIRRIVLVRTGSASRLKSALRAIRTYNSRRARALRFYRQGGKLVRKRRYRTAIPLFRRALRILPSMGKAWEELGGVYAHLKRYKEAVRAYGKSTAVLPRHFSSAWHEAAILHQRLDRQKLAIKKIFRLEQLYLATGPRVPARIYAQMSHFFHNAKSYNFKLMVKYRLKVAAGPYGWETRIHAWRKMMNLRNNAEDERNLNKVLVRYQRHCLAKIKSERDPYRIARIYRKLGQHLRRSDLHLKAPVYLMKAIPYYRKALRTASQKRRAYIFNYMGYCYYWSKRIPEAYQVLVKSYRLNKRAVDRTLILNAGWYMGFKAVFAGHSRRAQRYFVMAYEGSSHGTVQHKQFMAIAREYGRYRHIKPLVTHRILQVIVTNARVRAEYKDGRVMGYRDKIFPGELERIRFTTKIFEAFFKTLSRGKFDLKIDRLVINGTIRAAYNGNGHIQSFTGNPWNKLYRMRDKYDTFMYMWPAGSHAGIGTGGAGSIPLAPYSYKAFFRGHTRFPFNYTSWHNINWHTHEFWHTMESMIPMGPSHGWLKEIEPVTKRKYPDWKGHGEWSLYRYHFDKTIPRTLRKWANKRWGRGKYTKKMMYQFLRFTFRNRDPRYDGMGHLFRRLYNMTREIPFLKRLKAKWVKIYALENSGKKRYRKALKGMLKAYQMNPYSYMIVNHLIGLYRMLKQPEQMIKYMKRAVYLMPMVMEYSRCAWALYKQGNKQEALRVLERAYRRYPRHKRVFRELITMNRRMRRKNRALYYMKKRLEVFPTPGNYQDYADGLIKEKHKSEAMAVLKKSYNRYGGNGILGSLARMHARTGDMARARLYWRNIARHIVRQKGDVIRLMGEDAHIVSPRRIPVLRPFARKGKYELAWWTDRKEYIHWNLHVKKSGRYRVLIGCIAPGAKPSHQVYLIIGNRRVRFRVPRTWGTKIPLPTGRTIRLNRGRVEAILKTANPRKAASMNFRGIILERID